MTATQVLRKQIDAAPVSRGEWALIGLVFVTGTLLRCAYPDRMAVEHFDEGIYASDWWFEHEPDHRYPDQHLYAPPLLPTLIWTVFSFCGPSNLGAMVPSLVAGCLTVPLVWWVGRSWFGPATGLAAATLCALSDPHIVFSRTALTDVLLCFWLLLAVYFSWRALLTHSFRDTAAAGLFTALAWWTKYTGWLPLAIAGAAVVPWHVLCRRRGVIHSVLRVVAIAAIAGVLWSPWLWSLQSRGGYAAVANNHRGYVVGLSGWRESLGVHATVNLPSLEGFASQHAPLIALVIVVALSSSGGSGFTWNGVREIGHLARRLPRRVRGMLSLYPSGQADFKSAAAGGPSAMVEQAVGDQPTPDPRERLLALLGHPLTYVVAAGLFVLPALGGGLGSAVILTGIGLAAVFCVGSLTEEDAVGQRVTLAACLLAAWWLGLAVAIPAYRPYPRLLLPWLMASWLTGGLAIAFLVRLVGVLSRNAQSDAGAFFEKSVVRQRGVWPRATPLFGVIAAAVVGVAAVERHYVRWEVPGWDERADVARVARQFVDELNWRVKQGRLEKPFAIYTLGQPASLFQLRLSGAELVRPVSGVPKSPGRIPTFLVMGWSFGEKRDERLRYLSVGGKVYPSRVVLLDGGNVPARTTELLPSSHVSLWSLDAPEP